MGKEHRRGRMRSVRPLVDDRFRDGSATGRDRKAALSMGLGERFDRSADPRPADEGVGRLCAAGPGRVGGVHAARDGASASVCPSAAAGYRHDRLPGPAIHFSRGHGPGRADRTGDADRRGAYARHPEDRRSLSSDSHTADRTQPLASFQGVRRPAMGLCRLRGIPGGTRRCVVVGGEALAHRRSSNGLDDRCNRAGV